MFAACIHEAITNRLFGRSDIIGGPQCDQNGAYEQVQCNIRERICYCVDQDNGRELIGTRVPNNLNPNCQSLFI